MINLTINLINRIYHKCEKMEQHIIILRKYIIIFVSPLTLNNYNDAPTSTLISGQDSVGHMFRFCLDLVFVSFVLHVVVGKNSSVVA